VIDFMAPQVGLEPTTLRLTAECSTIELLRSNGDPAVAWRTTIATPYASKYHGGCKEVVRAERPVAAVYFTARRQYPLRPVPARPGHRIPCRALKLKISSTARLEPPASRIEALTTMLLRR
jgi:hypothetical protein